MAEFAALAFHLLPHTDRYEFSGTGFSSHLFLQITQFFSFDSKSLLGEKSMPLI
jgi:hypothetical protein